MILPVVLVLVGLLLGGYSMSVGFLPSQEEAGVFGPILIAIGAVLGAVRTARWAARTMG